MGWSYENRIAYGIIVNSWNHPGLKELLDRHSNVIGYDSAMSPEGKGTLFVYLKSTYI